MQKFYENFNLAYATTPLLRSLFENKLSKAPWIKYVSNRSTLKCQWVVINRIHLLFYWKCCIKTPSTLKIWCFLLWENGRMQVNKDCTSYHHRKCRFQTMFNTLINGVYATLDNQISNRNAHCNFTAIFHDLL